MFSTYEALFSLAEFATLVGREWDDPVLREKLPADKEKYGVVGIGLLGRLVFPHAAEIYLNACFHQSIRRVILLVVLYRTLQ